MEISTAFNHSSRFLSLPPEVRNKIYEYALCEDEPMELAADTIPSRRPFASHRSYKCAHLLQVCREIYHDAKLVPYIVNNFFFPGLNDMRGPRSRHLRFHFTDTHWAAIRTISMKICPHWRFDHQHYMLKQHQRVSACASLRDRLPGVTTAYIECTTECVEMAQEWYNLTDTISPEQERLLYRAVEHGWTATIGSIEVERNKLEAWLTGNGKHDVKVVFLTKD